jgi:hypothetical protein
MNRDFGVVYARNVKVIARSSKTMLLGGWSVCRLSSAIPKEKLAQSFLQFLTPLPVLNIRQCSDRRVENAINFAVG